MVIPSKGIFIVGAKRTPFCKYGGSLRETPACHVFAAAAKDAIQSSNIDPKAIDHTFVGNVHFLSQCDGGKTPRYCGIYSGVPIEKPALGINKACGSGLQAVINGALEILTGLAKVTLTGGTEQMSTQPHLVRNVRFGAGLGGSYQFEDHVTTQFVDSRSGMTLAKAAEELAMKNLVTREEADEYAMKSYLKWKAAQASNIFANELTSVTTRIKNKEITVTQDELPEPDLSFERLAAVSGSIITNRNSASPADGAAAVLLADEQTVTSQQLSPLARVTGWGPAAAVGVQQVDLFEINDIFATQAIITSRELDIDPCRVNVDGGAVTLGHPVAATGARMTVHLVHEMRRRNLKKGVVASSCGGGQGIALLLESM
ncbi:3-ketoacyl-CoA thiolase, mitochondrial-like [Plodia interpunctella]|uniref:3-ketoacyl-CoA thiolase, mitochondrial-like n=1 Tax=Plodia interpunctella TaxID=58824 RepID=UPI0023675AB2|nr:3-ketoacyl-CoA thiolase, mitochondrial-like [Plodia interpunctella]